MGRPIRAHQTGTIEGKTHRQVLQRYIVRHLIIAALQEGRIDGAERFHTIRRQTGREGDGVLFGDADIIGARREDFGETIQPRARRHGGGDGDDLVVDARLLDQFRSENICIARRIGLGLRLFAGNDVELGHAMVFIR